MSIFSLIYRLLIVLYAELNSVFISYQPPYDLWKVVVYDTDAIMLI